MTTSSLNEEPDSRGQLRDTPNFVVAQTGTGRRAGGGLVSAMVLPTLVVTVSRGFPSDDALLGISFRTMATVLSAALESFPYNSEIIASGQLDNSVLLNPPPPPPRASDREDLIYETL